MELSACWLRVERAARQVRRAQQAFLRDQQQLGALSAPGSMSASEQEAFLDFVDAMAFAVMAANQANQAQRYLADRGIELPRLTDAELIWSLRDLEQHWDEWLPQRDRPEHAEKPWLRTRRAGKRFENARPTNWTEGLYFGHDPHGLAEWNGLNVRRLSSELAELERLIHRLMMDALHSDGAD